jgi:CheY-like chemotaxis protein
LPLVPERIWSTESGIHGQHRDHREKCFDAGASDYISKPVNTDQLLSLMRVWLFR